MIGRSHIAFALMSTLFVAHAMPARAANIASADWGTTTKGEKVELFTLTSVHGLQARISNYGGIIVDLASWHFPDCGPDRHALLPDQKEFPVFGDRRDHNGGFAMHDRPRSRLFSGRRFNQLSRH